MTTEELMKEAPDWMFDREALDHLHMSVTREDCITLSMKIMDHPVFRLIWQQMEPWLISIGENPCRALWEGFFEMFLETGIANLVVITDTRTGEKWVVKQ